MYSYKQGTCADDREDLVTSYTNPMSIDHVALITQSGVYPYYRFNPILLIGIQNTRRLGCGKK